MKNYIQNTYLKLKELFPKRKNKDKDSKVLKELAGILKKNGYDLAPLPKQKILEELNRMQELAGIMDWKNRVIRQKAVDTVFKEEVDRLVEKIRNNPKDFEHVTMLAKTNAERQIEAHERAEYYGIQMEKNKQKIFDDIAKIENGWKAYFKKSGELEETADLFADYLVDKKFLTKAQLKRMNVSAVFIDGKIQNPLHFHQAMKNAKIYTNFAFLT